MQLNHPLHVVGGEPENHIPLGTNTRCYRNHREQGSWNSGSISGCFCWGWFFLFKSLRTLPQKVCYRCSKHLLTNALHYLRFERRGELISHHTAVDVRLGTNLLPHPLPKKQSKELHFHFGYLQGPRILLTKDLSLHLLPLVGWK